MTGGEVSAAFGPPHLADLGGQIYPCGIWNQIIYGSGRTGLDQRSWIKSQVLFCAQETILLGVLSVPNSWQTLETAVSCLCRLGLNLASDTGRKTEV